MRVSVVLSALLLALTPLHQLRAQDGGIGRFDVVGNEIGVTSLTIAEVRAIFRGERALWSNGLRVTVVLPSNRAPYAEAFAEDILGMRPAAMQRYWLALVFQGRAEPPVAQVSVPAALLFLARTPGSIVAVPRGTAPRELVIPVR
jgi:hypothetical protein